MLEKKYIYYKWTSTLVSIYNFNYTCNICFLLDNSSSNFEICSFNSSLSLTNFFLCTIRRIRILDKTLILDPSPSKLTLHLHRIKLFTSRTLSLLKLKSNIASACFSERLNSVKNTKKNKKKRIY